jgi:hypothetical protein
MIILYWGNIVIAAYALHQLHLANGDWGRFFLGNRAAGQRPSEKKRPGSVYRKYLWYTAAAACAVYAGWGIINADFALYPVIGCLWGFGFLSVGCLIAATSTRGT